MSEHDRALLEEINDRLKRLEDIEALRALIVDYACACDRGNDPEMLAPLFAEDGTWECQGFGKYVGREQVAKGLHGIAGEKIWWSLHYMISPRIELGADGDTATAFWYLWEATTIPNEHSGESEANWIGATYEASMVRREGRWQFASMELILNMCSPIAEGWVRKRFPDGTRRNPYFEQLEPGEYYWCACGRSANQPFCDGSHEGTNREPIAFTVEAFGLQTLCGCKYSKTKPWCDGSHLNLKLES